MRRSSESSGSGSAHKRRRLSSPTYEDQFPITQEDIARFDELEKQLSQGAQMNPHPRSRPSDTSKNHHSDVMDAALLGGDDQDWTEGMHLEGSGGQEWSSSPPNPSTTQERAAEEAFFNEGSGSGAGFVSAATLPAKPRQGPLLFSGFASAASLPLARPSHLPKAQAGSGFTAASKLPPANAHTINDEDAPPSTLTRFGGFGLASALPSNANDLYQDDRPPTPPDPPHQDYDSWFDSDTSSFPPAAFTFTTARTVMDTSLPAQAEAGPSSQTSSPATLGFTSGLAQWKAASFSNDEPEASTSDEGFALPAAPQIGFSSVASLQTGVSKKNWAAPSAEALARAAQRIKQWDTEDAAEGDGAAAPFAEENSGSAPPAADPAPPPSSSSAFTSARAAPPQPFQTPLRPALRPMENNGVSSASRLLDTPLASKNPVHYTDIGGGVKMKNTQFKSPLVSRNPRPGATPMPSTLNRRPEPSRVASGSKLPSAFGFGSAANVVPVTPARPVPQASVSPPVSKGPVATTSPVKGRTFGLGMTPARVGAGLRPLGKAKFSTPFKKGMGPGEPGRTQLEVEWRRSDAATQTPARMGRTPSVKVEARKEYKFFDLNPPPERKNLASCGLRPQAYTEEDLEDMGINVAELRQMSPSNAIYYSFHSVDPSTDPEQLSESMQLGPEAAYASLMERGCPLAKQEWVTNHYGLILWKLAGMVCLEPERESDPRTKRWCWPEVMRQLLYRYERELNGGSRPALRLICTEDAPAMCPMVLCVSDITWSNAGVDAKGIPLDSHPELEVTDGWYRLRAKVDLPLARAVRRGRINIGTKLAVSGARLSGDRKEAGEILQSYDNTWLELEGNSTHLAQWHAKLGFVKEPFVATLDSLTGDGGSVPATDLVVVKVYPIAYLEFVRNEDGSMTKFGPRNEKEELNAQDQWLTKRENEIAKIRTTLEKQVEQLEKMAERLRSIAGSRFQSEHKADDVVPDHIEDLYSEFVDEETGPSPQLFDGLNYKDAGWLQVHARHQISLAKERVGEDIERELQHVCPPRSVRDFRVVVVRDARWHKKEPTRTAQITLWDPMRMVFSEGGRPGDIREGQRFFVTNLAPNQPNAWMTPGPDSVVYLVSKKNARWTNIKANKLV